MAEMTSDPVENLRRIKKEGISPERVRELILINKTLDQVVEKIVELLIPAINAMDGFQFKLALIQKLERALDSIRETIHEEEAKSNGNG